MIGKVLQGRYQIVQILSAGVFGQIYIAEDVHQPGNPKCVVKQLKVVTSEPNYLANIRERFSSESRTLKHLGYHDRIPHLIASFEEDDQFYLVQEFIHGHALTAELPINQRWGQPWSESEVVNLLQEVLGILEFIHSQDTIHCDIKPDNLIRRAYDNKLFLIDFGSVQPCNFDVEGDFPIFRVPVTSLGYIPPEQFNRNPQPNSDIYALGMIAIQALTGLAPMDLKQDSITNEAVWRTAQTYVSDRLAAILDQMIRYDYKKRFQTATEVLEALDQLWINIEVVSDTYNTIASSILNAEEMWRERSLPVATPPTTPKPSFLLMGIKAGIAVNSLVMGMGVYSLVTSAPAYSEPDTLTQARQEYQSGDFDQAITLAKSIPERSPIYPEAQAAIQEWSTDWQTAQQQYQLAQTAYKEQKWQEVLEHIDNVPKITYWQTKANELSATARTKVETQAEELLQQAYTSAEAKDFSAALDYLQQISADSPVSAIAQQKVSEYTEKRDIRAVYVMQKAFDSAQTGDFNTAVKFLQLVPKHSPSYYTALLKISEYNEKERLKNVAQNNSYFNPTTASSTPATDKPSINSNTATPLTKTDNPPTDMNKPFIKDNSATKLQNFQPGNGMSEVNINKNN